MSLFQNNFPAGVVSEISGNKLSLTIPDNSVLESPIHLKIDGASLKQLFIKAGISTRVRILLDYTGPQGSVYESKQTVEVRMAQNACVNFCEIHKPGNQGSHSAANIFYLNKFSDLNYLSFANGGVFTNIRNEVHFGGEHGFASLKGLSVLGDYSQVRNHLIMNHTVPGCISRQFYKNILGGHAKSEFDSLVHVEKDAFKSDSEQLNKNLLLSDNAEAFSKPKLKIDTDDVACKHGAVVGQLETNELFYLRSRGIPKEEARYILTYGFAEEIIESLEDAPLRKTLEDLASLEIREALSGLKT